MSNNVCVGHGFYVELVDETSQRINVIDDLKNQADIFKSLLALSLPYVEEMASLTESPDDAALAAEIKDCLGAE